MTLQEPNGDVSLDSGVEVDLGTPITTLLFLAGCLHQADSDITLDAGVEIYLDFQIQLDLDLQTAVPHLLGLRTVLDARFADCAGAAAHVACDALVHRRRHLLLLVVDVVLRERALLLLLLWLLARCALHGALALLLLSGLLLLCWCKCLALILVLLV